MKKVFFTVFFVLFLFSFSAYCYAEEYPVRGCVNKSTRALRIITGPAQCSSQESSITWHVLAHRDLRALAAVESPEDRLADLEMRVFAEINQQRRNNGLRDLIWRDDIARAARLHSGSMGVREFFSHDDPFEGDLKQRLSRMGVNRWGVCGENILKESRSYNSVRQAVECWMNSQHHRENILNPTFTHTGIGVARGLDNLLYFTQDFILAR